MTTVLDEGLLGAFEEALRDAGARITDVWAPGLTDAEMDALTAPFALRLPEEARCWWRWHNGVIAGAQPPDWDLLPRRSLLDLATTLENFRGSRASRVVLYDGGDYWLEPLTDLPLIFFACDGPSGEPVPVHTQQDVEDPIRALPSIGELVARWTRLIRDGAFQTDDHGHWTWSFERIPEDVRRLGIY